MWRMRWGQRTAASTADKPDQHFRQGICLGKHGRCRLGENLVADIFGHLRSHVNIGNAGFRNLQAFGLYNKIDWKASGRKASPLQFMRRELFFLSGLFHFLKKRLERGGLKRRAVQAEELPGIGDLIDRG